MDPQVLLHQLRQRYLASGAKPCKVPLERPLGFLARGEPAHLRPLRAAPVDAVPIRPPRLPVAPATTQLQNLTVLCHRGTSSNRVTNQGSDPTNPTC
jgi:hypothetical protein